MVTEFADRSRGSHATTLVMTGYHVGAVVTAAGALWALRAFGWHAMFLLGSLPALVLLPLMWFRLPESPSYLMAKGRTAEARDVARETGVTMNPETAQLPRAHGTSSDLMKPPYLRNTVLSWFGAGMGLLLVYGLNTWLPQIMRSSGYDLGNSLGMLLVLNAGAVAGLLLAGFVADRLTPRVTGIVWFAASAVLLALLVVKLPLAWVYLMLFVTGVFVFSANVMVYAFVALNSPPALRATALGLSAGIGRIGAISGPIIGGSLLSAGVAYPWGFFAYAGAGAIGLVSMVSSKTLKHHPSSRR